MPRSSSLIEAYVSGGIEYETDETDPRILNISEVWRTTHDASCETPNQQKLAMAGINWNIDTQNSDQDALNLFPRHNFTKGTELVSCILDTSSLETFEEIKKLTKALTELGEPEGSLRSGIHFHISYPSPNLRMLKAILRLGKFLEDVFFVLGGMGTMFRGQENDSTYCRAITKYGPPCVPYGDSRFAQIFYLKDLFRSESMEEFWVRYGDCPSNGGRYHPVRYTWLNLYPLNPYGGPESYKGTVEFRIFNKTLNPHYIWATLQFCKRIVEFSVESSFKSLRAENLLKENSIYNVKSKAEIFEHFEMFSTIAEVDPEIRETIAFILERSPVPQLNKNYIFSHLISTRDLTGFWRRSSYHPRLVSRSEIVKPNYVDSHVLLGERR